MTDSQFDLFGKPVDGPKVRVPAVTPDPRTAMLIARLPAALYLGTSSWSFPGWAGRIYARPASTVELARAGLEAYAAYGAFRTVCIDRSYHAPLAATEFARYADSVPADFRFVVKAHSACTMATRHEGGSWRPNRHFLDAGYATDAVIGPYVEGLGGNAGVLVFQFPPVGPDLRRNPQAFADRLQGFLEALPKETATYAVEIRDAALFGPWFARAIRESGSHYCHSLHPRMPPVGKQRALMAGASDGPLIVRWNLHPTQTYEGARARYQPFNRLVDQDPSTRLALARLAREALAAGRQVFVITNNKAEGCAPLSALALAGAIVQRPG